MSTLTVWPHGAATAIEPYWNFRRHCIEMIEPYGPLHNKGLREIMQSELTKWGGSVKGTDNLDLIFEFKTEKHQSLWLIHWIS